VGGPCLCRVGALAKVGMIDRPSLQTCVMLLGRDKGKKEGGLQSVGLLLNSLHPRPLAAATPPQCSKKCGVMGMFQRDV